MSIDPNRDKNGEIGKKHRNTLVRTLRKMYGPNFAKNHGEMERLFDVLHDLDPHSLSQLVKHHEEGKLAGEIAKHA